MGRVNMQRFLERAFIVCLMLSVATAFILVLTQLLGLVMGDGNIMIRANEILLTPAIVLAALFSAFAFILGYFPKYKQQSR